MQPKSIAMTLLNILGSFSTGVVITIVICLLVAIFAANSEENFPLSKPDHNTLVFPATISD
ncbi:hypothetical protein [Floridanema aerugineum]|uniref:Photosystem II reaction center protein Z n=1 Tax=Floridaenema aerugineum BLCC-F46 TaxID=3153654 RepID=A0ABV4XB62_9CYAN